MPINHHSTSACAQFRLSYLWVPCEFLLSFPGNKSNVSHARQLLLISLVLRKGKLHKNTFINTNEIRNTKCINYLLLKSECHKSAPRSVAGCGNRTATLVCICVCVCQLANWTVEQSNSWTVEQLTSWPVEQLSSWTVEQAAGRRLVTACEWVFDASATIWHWGSECISNLFPSLNPK